MKTMIIATLLASTAFAAADNKDTHTIAAGSATRALRSNSANALTEDSLVIGGMTYGYKLPVEVIPHLAVWAEAGFGVGNTTGEMFQTLTTSIDSLELFAGGRARYELHSRLVVSGRLSLGTARQAVAIEDTMGHRASDRGWGGTTTVAGALDFLPVDNEYLGLGLRFEVGYTMASAINLIATPERADDGTIKLPMADAALGDLDMSGPSIGFQILGRF